MGFPPVTAPLAATSWARPTEPAWPPLVVVVVVR